MANEVPVFVMLPLDSVDSVTSEPERSRFKERLGALKNAGVEGVMMDVWWGRVERDAPRKYNWSAYKDLLKMVGDCGLKVQAVMSFHKCGGNVGDPVTIPLPPWVVEEILQNNDLAYTDKWYSSLKDERPNDEYISLGCDDLPLLGLGERTPVQCYADFMRSFKENFTDLMGKTVVEIQVGMGPAGELRYPSYPLSKWKFPGIGAFQCYDKYMQVNLKARAKDIGKEEWGHAPTDAGDYNSLPEETGFFCPDGGWMSPDGGWMSPYGEFFLNWYFSMLLDHGERILKTAELIFRSSGVRLSGKVAGIHWHYSTTSHAPELTAGYYNTIHRDGYLPIAQMFQRCAVVFNFTCTEMKDEDHPADANCSPEKLVEQVIQATGKATIRLAGENALPRFDGAAYTQICIISRRVPLCAFTYLRMSEPLFVEENWKTFVSFVRSMSDKNAVSIPRDGKQ